LERRGLNRRTPDVPRSIELLIAPDSHPGAALSVGAHRFVRRLPEEELQLRRTTTMRIINLDCR
jgi:hypothetical protein